MITQDTYKLAKTDLGQQRKQKMGRRPSKMVCSAYAGLYALQRVWRHGCMHFSLIASFEMGGAGAVVVSPGRDTA